MAKTALLIPDTHRPYHHYKAYRLMLEIASSIQPDEIIILGDYADFYAVQMHGARQPGLLHDLKTEIDDVVTGLDEIDKLFPKSKKIYIEGNHEFRLERFLTQNALPIYHLYSIKEMLGIPKRKWTWIPYQKDQGYPVLGTNLIARHEPLGGSAMASLRKAMCSHTYGHVHKIEEANLVTLDGKNITAFSTGWLGNSELKVFNYLKTPPQWQLGFGIVMTSKSNWYHQKVPIISKNNQLSAVATGTIFSV